VGRMLKNTIIGNTPVRTGNLQSRNNYDVRDKILTLYNTADYAEFVELGTIFQTANPFMRNSIYQKIDEIRLIMEAELKE
jgi:HK97 gp10 family phage protein